MGVDDAQPPALPPSSLSHPPSSTRPVPTRIVEFFSGIGGFHAALSRVFPDATVVAAYDTNRVANAVYAHNYGQTPSPSVIDRLSLAELERHRADCFTLSPPCQPFTDGGKRLDHADPRSAALLHLIALLPRMACPPATLVLENVPNFETSVCRDRLLACLTRLQYTYKEFLFSPLALGIPNHRRRYYLLAQRTTADVAKTAMDSALVPTLAEHLGGVTPPDAARHPQWRVPEDVLRKRVTFRFDAVTLASRTSSTFTKAYGSRHVFGSGSCLQTQFPRREDPDDEDGNAAPPPTIPATVEVDWDDAEAVIALGLRFFTPREVARLQGFPVADAAAATETGPVDRADRGRRRRFAFPPETTCKQQWRLLGNSLSIDAVAFVLSHIPLP
ncbi:hypothetical protein CXG81DRAFT_11228 [Caulochytrium protostelioides]|uniref:S-adenosyl-L-methionine-dependent methyltransferase n=1 Tax=Caulochytrium protostelioides TaxID=1555241 RepID=A0A4P9X9Q1_9FUNG|nr:hypothetical protein CXG81DRAFT_11228 [Caulochytrium protostelioides]|eukprot:RKP02087.1 hypothetical protein CXG81DRAFT_11228 [Caulochytrium protostelioides]